jgi:hypothetical protein
MARTVKAVPFHSGGATASRLVLSRNSLVLWQILAGFPALQAVVAAILHQAHFVLAHAKIAILIATTFLFHHLADSA